MEIAALSGHARPVAAVNDPASTDARKTVQREASVESTRVSLSEREDRQRASQAKAPGMLYQQLGRAHSSGSASLSDEAIDLFSAHSETDFDARNQLAAGGLIDTSTVRDSLSNRSS